ncbi:MAG: hypothetical protein NWQ54_25750 [Paraglaciecola sp.]|nr:hypothetical protein [Paraglaciecola sp.]
MNLKLIPIVILFTWLCQAGLSSLKNSEYAKIVSVLSRTSKLGECKISVDITRSWPFSWTVSSAAINIKNQDMALTSYTSKFNVPDRTFLRSHNTNYHFTWSRQLEDQLVASFVDVEIKPDGSIHAVNIGNCSNYQENNELIGNLAHCNSPVQVIKCT